jgi:hypothetical protein
VTGLEPQLAWRLRKGMVIVAHPLALTEKGTLDEVRQRALTRYYRDSGAGGVAVGVHTTQFAIHRPEVGLYPKVLALAREALEESPEGRRMLKVAGVVGDTRQAVEEAALARSLGYHAALVSMHELSGWSEAGMLSHLEAVGKVLPVFGFYLQPAVGGRRLSYTFWRKAAELESMVAIKIAPFDRYATLEVVRAVSESSRREEIALYTGNDDAMVVDLLTPYRLTVRGQPVEMRIVGGLLGQWAVWTRRAVELFQRIQEALAHPTDVEILDLLAYGARLTRANAAIFDAAHGFRGCLAGIHYVLAREGLLAGMACLDPEEGLSPGQAEEIDEVLAAYPELSDADFVAQHLAEWLGPEGERAMP